jgi:hypothetical protein
VADEVNGLAGNTLDERAERGDAVRQRARDGRVRELVNRIAARLEPAA